ncbi:MAG: hypothetical protein AAB875_03425, partial [Patescibacteria group bacterium]
MDEHRKMIWQRGDARQIMREARRRFSSLSPQSQVALASAHYSLVKRYWSWWQWPLALWHMWRAWANANMAVTLVDDPVRLTSDQIDVVTTIWIKSPGFLRDLRRAEHLLTFALIEKPAMKPHTNALMLITLRDILWKRGEGDYAWE